MLQDLPGWMPESITLLAAWVFCLVAVGWIKIMVERRNIKAHANDRSVKHDAVPVGAGWAILIAILVGWPLAAWPLDTQHWWVLIWVAVLGGVSWLDDMFTVKFYLRFAMHAAAVASLLLTFPETMRIFPFVDSLWLDRVLAGLCWIWFINLYNFMDGIDGIAGSEALSVALGLVCVSTVSGLQEFPNLLAVIVAGASLGFLWWNWYPAKIILGDVGSITLGFVLGWLLIKLSVEGHLIAALILPSVFVADASLTLLSRLLRGQKIWLPHREHFYQRAVLRGLTPAQVDWRMIFTNGILILAALLAVVEPLLGIGLAVIAVAGLLLHLQFTEVDS